MSAGRGWRTGKSSVRYNISAQAHLNVTYRYPGCACDIPSVNYQFSWAIKIWTHYYSYSPEIWEYLQGLYKDNDLYKYVKLKHKIEGAEWNDEKGKWILKVRDMINDKVFDDECHFFINAGGVLNNFKWPQIPGLETYKNKLMHSAQYEEGYPLDGKKVAVLGAGSSGVQIVANIQKKVDTLYHWIRNPIWITAGESSSLFKYHAFRNHC